jgi:hypothetical protein
MTNPTHKRYESWGLRDFTARYAGLSLRPARGDGIRLVGELAFRAATGEETVEDSFEVDVRFPRGFPDEIPTVFETEGRIPPDFHKLEDGSLCLGSPLRLRLILTRHPTVTGFVERCVIPYLFGFAVWTRTGRMPFGELAHGAKGIFQDLMSLLGARDKAQCLAFLKLLSLPKRHANKRPCPCGSALRLGRCHNRTLHRLRAVGSRSYYAYQCRRFGSTSPDLRQR